jgi:hypothetical protein
LPVAATAARWGHYRPRAGGKVVWAELALPGPEPAVDPGEAPVPLPRRGREPAAFRHVWPVATLPVTFSEDPAVLRRVADGLRALDDWTPPEANDGDEPA